MSGLPAGIDRLGPYEIVREVGCGAMGAVYLGRAGAERVALKVIHEHLVREPRFFKRFEREAEAGSRVRHPNVVRTLDHGTSAAGDLPLCYLVMEFVEGRTLRSLLRELRTVPEALLLEIARQTTAGLAAIHEAGIVHRDLKPENVLITNDDRIRIMDLGIARITDAASTLTREGEFSGSLPYAAPEQLQGEDASPSADLYALGVVLYELGTGHNPFDLDSLPAVIHAHLKSVPERAATLNPELSTFLSEVLACLLAKEVEARFASARELLEVLEAGEDSTWWSLRRRQIQHELQDVPDVPVRRETRLHGRGTELAALERCWQSAQRGEGRVVLLEGEAGIGKSRLVDAFLRSADTSDAHVLYGSYAPSGGLGAVSDAILEKFGADGLEDALRPYTKGMPSLVASFATSVKHDAAPGRAPPVPHDALHAVLVEFMRGLAAERPLLWIVEDLHFAGVAAHRRALSMARGVAGHRVCLLLTTRPGRRGMEMAHLGRLEAFQRLPLTRLGAREVILLLQDAFRSATLADRLGARIALKSDGVPFFVFEVIRELRERAFIKELSGGRWIESRPIREIDVPSAVRDLIQARVSDMTKDERAILDVGAVQGFEFDPRRTAGVLERGVVALLQNLAEIERRIGVVRAVGRNYRFDHHQIQEVLYEQLPPRLREDYHATLADEIARVEGDEPDDSVCAELCRHYVEGGRQRDALPWLERALDHLSACCQQEDLTRIGQQMLAAPGCLTGSARVGVLLRLAKTMHLLGRRGPEQDLLLEARDVAEATGEAKLQVRAATGLGRYLVLRARFDEATEVLETAIERARDAGTRPLEMGALGVLGAVCYGRGRFEEAREHYERQRELARELGDRSEVATATGMLGTALSKLGRFDEAEACFRVHLAAAQEAHDLHGEAMARGNLGIDLTNQGRYEEAREQFEQQRAISAEIGNRYGEGKASGCLGAVSLLRGEHEQARQHYEHELEIDREIGDRRSEALATGNLGIIHDLQGRRKEARACFQTWLDVSREIGNRSGEAHAHGQLGVLGLYGGEDESHEAREHLEQSRKISGEIGDRQGEAEATARLGVLLFKAGHCEEARANYLRHFEVSREIGDRRGLAHAHGNLGDLTLALGRFDEAEEHYGRSLEIAEEIGNRRSEARAHGGRGTVACRQGRYEKAREHQEIGARIARDVEDRVVEGQASELLGRIHADQGREEEARDAFGRQLAIARETGNQEATAVALVRLGALDVAEGRVEEARGLLEEAGRIGASLGAPDVIVLPACHLAGLPGGDPAGALAVFEEWKERLEHDARMEARVLLWRATGDAAHLEAARRLLDEALAHTSQEHHEAMTEAVPLHRAILAPPA